MKQMILLPQGQDSLVEELQKVTRENVIWTTVSDVRECMDILQRDQEIAAILADTPSKLPDFPKLAEYVGNLNNYIVKGHPISVSLGYSILQTADEDFDSPLKRSDESMYEDKKAKKAG